MSQAIGIGPLQKMAPLDQHVARDNDLAIAPNTHQRSVVTHTKHGVRRAMSEVTPDQCKLGSHRRQQTIRSAARCRRFGLDS